MRGCEFQSCQSNNTTVVVMTVVVIVQIICWSSSAGLIQEDLRKVDALEWLIFNTKQRPEALLQANAIMRVFLG